MRVQVSFLRLGSQAVHQTSNARVALCMIAIVGATLACQRSNPPGAIAPSRSSSLQLSATPRDSAPRCINGIPIELASGRIANSQLCITQHGDTSYGIAYSRDHREVFRMAEWHVTHALFDSTLQVLTARLDQERGTGRPCPKQGIERYWGSPPNILILRIAGSDLNGLPVSMSLAQEAELPSC